MTRIRDYEFWEEDFYDPYGVNGDTVTKRGKKKKKNEHASTFSQGEEED